MLEKDMIELALREGFSAAAIMDVKDIVFDPMFRPFCAENLCGHYGENYTCPPDCGSVEEMKARLQAYSHALVFQSKWPITDYSDQESIREAKAFHNSAMRKVIGEMKRAGYKGVMAGASCCTLCPKCEIWAGRACHFPEEKWSCLSAYCIFVRKLAECCGIEYTCTDGSLAFFGLYAF